MSWQIALILQAKNSMTLSTSTWHLTDAPVKETGVDSFWSA